MKRTLYLLITSIATFFILSCSCKKDAILTREIKSRQKEFATSIPDFIYKEQGEINIKQFGMSENLTYSKLRSYKKRSRKLKNFDKEFEEFNLWVSSTILTDNNNTDLQTFDTIIWVPVNSSQYYAQATPIEKFNLREFRNYTGWLIEINSGIPQVLDELSILFSSIAFARNDKESLIIKPSSLAKIDSLLEQDIYQKKFNQLVLSYFFPFIEVKEPIYLENELDEIPFILSGFGFDFIVGHEYSHAALAHDKTTSIKPFNPSNSGNPTEEILIVPRRHLLEYEADSLAFNLRSESFISAPIALEWIFILERAHPIMYPDIPIQNNHPPARSRLERLKINAVNKPLIYFEMVPYIFEKLWNNLEPQLRSAFIK